MVDAIIALSILVIGIIAVFAYFYVNPGLSEPVELVNTISSFFLENTFSDISSNYVQLLLIQGVVNEHVFLSEKMAELCYTSNTTFYQEFINRTIASAIPGSLSFEISVLYDNNTPCLSHSRLSTTDIGREDSRFIASSRDIIFNFNNATVMGPYFLEVTLW
ncbi:MAG: hypothetical protein ACMXYK_04965 [Candidatus Woesearchaeota archaeon]